MDSKSEFLRSLGRQVYSLRKARSWSRRELARHSGVSERFLADIENGRGNPSLGRIYDLSTSLGTTPAALLQSAPMRLPSSGSGARTIALLGLRGAGKSSVGSALAERLQWPFVELDVVVEEQAGMRLAELFELHGQAYYRRLERQALETVLERAEPVVLSTGGGLVTEPRTYDLLQANTDTVWLRAAPEDHWERVVAQGDTRPMQGNDEAFVHLCAILQERERLYEQAQFTVDTSATPFEEVCVQVASRFADSST
ncbi:MAG: shikimate kinase [Planctomycetota bacterium]|nr:shikimate kinase [Planctomycetota bacterium]